MSITREQALSIFNDLNRMATSIAEGHDIYLSDIRNLDDCLWTLKKEFGIVPQMYEDGSYNYYSDYVLKEDVSDD